VRAREITEAMKMAAAHGIAAIVSDDELREDHVIPVRLQPRGRAGVAEAVAGEARASGCAQADGCEFGYADGDTTELRAISS